jgi:hypothetical protein
MDSDDLTALSGIFAGALASAALTFALVMAEPVRSCVRPSALPAPPAPLGMETFPGGHTLRPGPVIDFAILRVEPGLMAGPESPPTGWDPGLAERSPMR